MAKFPLEQVLKYNQSMKDQKSLELALAQKAVDACLHKIFKTRQKIQNLKKSSKNILEKLNYDAGLMQIQQNYYSDHEKELNTLSKELLKLKKVLILKRQELVALSVKVKTFETLKNKYLTNMFKKMKRLEIKNMDDFATQHYLINKR